MYVYIINIYVFVKVLANDIRHGSCTFIRGRRSLDLVGPRACQKAFRGSTARTCDEHPL